MRRLRDTPTDTDRWARARTEGEVRPTFIRPSEDLALPPADPAVVALGHLVVRAEAVAQVEQMRVRTQPQGAPEPQAPVKPAVVWSVLRARDAAKHRPLEATGELKRQVGRLFEMEDRLKVLEKAAPVLAEALRAPNVDRQAALRDLNDVVELTGPGAKPVLQDAFDALLGKKVANKVDIRYSDDQLPAALKELTAAAKR